MNSPWGAVDMPVILGDGSYMGAVTPVRNQHESGRVHDGTQQVW